LWDRVGTSAYGPAPGFLTGGANPNYDWDGCCPSNCGSGSNNSKCYSESISPPKDQPRMKSYKDFNTSWPLNSWSVTENSCGYQIQYICLLSKYVTSGMDCHGDINGTAFIDSCGVCAGGNTGIPPVLDSETCAPEVDCEGNSGGAAFIDSCGICSGGGTQRIPILDKEGCNDCNGDFNGEAFLDECGNCSGGNTGLDPVLDYTLCYDCNEEYNGTAFIDSCGICAGGSTGVVAILDPENCSIGIFNETTRLINSVQIFPNPNSGILNFHNPENLDFSLRIYNINGVLLREEHIYDNVIVDLQEFESGYYELIIVFKDGISRRKLILL
jgi:hypothetical protein